MLTTSHANLILVPATSTLLTMTMQLRSASQLKKDGSHAIAFRKKDPNAAISEAVKPIVYYMDPGAPEPIRSALMDGARWWNQAFEAAGYKDAFRVEVLPEDADPMDVRYNMINWVHRSTRGWSYGSSVIDPRTGEIIKGHVTLGSLRVRQDFLIAEGLLSPYEEGKPASKAMEANGTGTTSPAGSP